MSRSAQDVLEFDKLRHLLRQRTTCAPGRRHLDKLQPGTDRGALESEFDFVREAGAWLRMGRELGFGALADPTRRAILERLLRGDASVGELAEPFRMTTRAVSKHIAVLEAAGLVTRARDAQRRPSRIRVDPLITVDEWLQLYRQRWTGRFQQLGKRLREQQGKD